MKFSMNVLPMLLRLLIGINLYLVSSAKRYKYDRIYEDLSAINFADPTKNGFRIILAEQFIQTHLRPSSLPTIFVSAIPLAGQGRVSKILYPDAVKDDKLVTISGLAERSWYYVCVEWENINHHNETTGTSCKIYRTLDRFGKAATTAVSDVAITRIGATLIRFKVKFDAEYPARITAYLNGLPLDQSPNRDVHPPMVPAQTFITSRPGLLDVYFPFLEPMTQYGQLCIMEEPMQPAYSAMGRLITGLHREKCYFDILKTKSQTDDGVPMATQPAQALKVIVRSASDSAFASHPLYLFTESLLLSVLVLFRKSVTRFSE